MLFLVVSLATLLLCVEGGPLTHPETMGGAFEGDMILPPNVNQRPSTRGAAIFGLQRRWPNNTIPYDLSKIPDNNHRRLVVESMNQLMDTLAISTANNGPKRLCVYFRPVRFTDQRYLSVQYGGGCSATVGYNDYFENTLNLSPNGCFYPGVIYHELLHNLGFFHEQSRADRDSYVTIKYENIHEEQKHNFEKYEWGQWIENQGLPYDYRSIMHYGADYFTKNGQPTIVPKDPTAVIGNREKLTEIDIAEVRKYYGCDRFQ